MGNLMKKVLLIFFIIFTIIEAQVKIDYGVKFGFTLSDLTYTEIKSFPMIDFEEYFDGNSINPSIGVFVNFRLTDNLILENDFSYTIKGSRKTENINYSSYDNPEGPYNKSKQTSEYSTHNLELGLNLKPIVKIGDVPYYAILGVSLNYNVLTTFVIQDRVTELMGSYRLGLGVYFEELLNIPLFVELKFSNDFSNYYSSDYYKLTNRVFSFTTGLCF